eukprot:TRINITY_DN171_c0_g1_i5.p1 TRINITY_DN171_c0_g1~~TRINITY_DN171_c0_g1_i5.p1  ORF type:complete len:191 (+),score=22.41 TRINITY_DN171_c0_g1_i5:646-1218(+)
MKKEPKQKDDTVTVSTTYDIMCWVDSTLMHREEFRVCESCTKQPKFIHLEKSKDVFMSGLVSMTVDLDRDVFYIGETFSIKVKVDNQSRKNVDNLKVKLIGIASVQIAEKRRVAMYEEYRTEYEGVNKRSCDERLLTFTIAPNIWPSSRGKVSSYQYQLHVVADLKQAFPIEFCMDITITIPKAMKLEKR